MLDNELNPIAYSMKSQRESVLGRTETNKSLRTHFLERRIANKTEANHFPDVMI